MATEKPAPAASDQNEQSPPHSAPVSLRLLRETFDDALQTQNERMASTLENVLDQMAEKRGWRPFHHPTPTPSSGNRLSGLAMRLGLNAALRSGKFPDGNQQNALKMALVNSDLQTVIATNPAAPFAADPGATGGQGRDWAGFFSAFADFLTKIMPLILQIVQALGGLTPVSADRANLHLQGAVGMAAMPPWLWTILQAIDWQQVIAAGEQAIETLVVEFKPAA